MTGTELAKAYHNAVSTLADGYGHVLEVLSTENAALRLRVGQLDAELDEMKKALRLARSQRAYDVGEGPGPVDGGS